MKKDNLPEEIYFEEKVGSNGIHCLDYKNESDIKYIREDVVNKLLIAHVSNSLPKNTDIVDRSHMHHNDKNANDYPISDFSFRQGAMWLKRKVLGLGE